MQTKKQKQQIHVLAAASLLVIGATPYNQLETTSDGFKKHSGTASGGQEVHSLMSKIVRDGGGKGKHTVQIKVGGQEITMLTTDAEVGIAQLLGELAAINKDAGAKA